MQTMPTLLQPLPVSDAQKQSARARTELSRNEFFSLMIAELQHQDPLEPMKNSELLSQMTQMETLSSSAKSADGIEKLVSALNFQQLTIASSFIGTVVRARDAAGADIQGIVGKVAIQKGQVTLTLQIPVVDAAGNVVKNAQGQALTREVPVRLDSVVEVMAPGLADFGSTIVDPNAAPPADAEAAEEPEPETNDGAQAAQP